ncbi:MAG: hypothetical protein AAB462_00280 [Patescibacteria group bacterium]
MSADYNDLPSYLNETYDQYISSKPEDSITHKGNFTPSLQFMIYSPHNSETDYVDIVKGAEELSDYPKCSDFAKVEAYAVTADANANGRTLIGTQAKDLDCNQNGTTFRLSGLKGTFKYRCSARLSANSSCSASPSYSVIAVRITVKANTSVFADVQASSNSRLSYIGDNNIPSEGPNSYTGVSRSLPEAGGSLISSEFSPPCNYSGGRAYVYWKDADSSEPPNGGEQVKFYLYEQGKSTPLDEGEAYGDGEIHHTSFVPKKGKHYRIVFSPVRKRNVSQNIASNTIKIWPPFDSAQPRCVNPTGTGDATCTNWSKDITDHSLWRISVFSVGSEPTIRASGNNAVNDGVTPPYPSGEGGHTGAAIDQWAKFKNLPTPVVYDESPSHDYTLTHNFQPPSSSGWYVFTEHWFHQSNGNWQYFYDALPFQANCYAASCTMTVDGNLPNGSSNVQAGSYNWGATAFVNNTGRQPLQMLGDTIPAGANGYPVDIDTPQAPTSQGHYPNYVGGAVTAAPWGPSYSVASCAAAVNAYQHFTLVPTAGINPATDDQDPTVVSYNTSVTYGPDPYPFPYGGPISSNVHSKLKYDPVSGGETIVMNTPRSGSYGTPPPYTDVYTNPNPIVAGDQYCPEMTIDTATGWIGPGGILYPASATSDSGCLTVVNKPYFKTYGSGVKAGGGFVGAGNGEISAWTNNVDGTFPYGSGAQLVAFANGDITGFASAQGVAGLSTSSLSFANNSVSVNTGTYSPRLGGNFNNTHASTVIDVKPTEGAPADGILGGRTVNGNQAIESSEDIYITGNITYGSGPWTADSIPSFVLSTTGNIYIAPNVTRLDGVYTSQRANGAIYTCSKNSGGGNFDPISANVPADNFFSTCKNQLLVHGSFVADKIHLMRTYGSLRDEKPTPTTTPKPVRYTRNTNYCFGENDALTNANCRAAGYTNCIRIDEAYNPGYPYVWWSDNWLCNRPSDGVIMQWTPAGANLALPKCANWSPGGRDNSGWAWSDNKLCISGSKNISFQSSNQTTVPNSFGEYQRYCIHLYDASDPNTGGVGGGAWLCEEQIVTDPGSDGSPHANVADPCSNGINVGAIRVDTRTCAAEVFDFSPDLYLSNPSIELPGRSKLRFDSITSLPPIL